MSQLFNRIEIKGRRRSLRNNMPKAEAILWSRLKGRQVKGLKFRRQQGVGRYVLDFYCPALRLAIEIDGDSHYMTNEVINTDVSRNIFIESLGITVLRFTNTEIYDNLDGVLQRIATTPCPSSSRRGKVRKSTTPCPSSSRRGTRKRSFPPSPPFQEGERGG